MATTQDLQISGNMTGLSESSAFTMEETGPVDVVYEINRCTAAWLETQDEQGVKRKIPILPAARNGSASRILEKGTAFKVVAALGRGGFLRAQLYY